VKEFSESRVTADSLLQFIDSAPTPWHAASVAAERLSAAGFEALAEDRTWELRPGRGYFVLRDGSAIVGFRVGAMPLPESGIRIIGAHTDSPGFRLKPLSAGRRLGYASLAVEVYGGPIIASFTDRDLTLAGRVVIRDGGRILTRLVNLKRPLVRFPNLAIHLNRDVNEAGLKLQAQDELSLVFGVDDTDQPADGLRRVLADELGLAGTDLLGWDLAVVDTQPGQIWGKSEEFIAAPRLDNLASCDAALAAITAVAAPEATTLVALFDHEEIGSESYGGAAGTLLRDTLERIFHAQGISAEQAIQSRARSLLISADMAHATHPNFPRSSDDLHPVQINGGPVIKHNAKLRYATDSVAAAYFRSLCERVNVGCQVYSHRNDLPCGSTIGPIAAAGVGIRTIDVGNPMWSMHSVRETGGVRDHLAMTSVMTEFFREGRLPFV
jgi:aspartyl aminopeptidase